MSDKDEFVEMAEGAAPVEQVTPAAEAGEAASA